MKRTLCLLVAVALAIPAVAAAKTIEVNGPATITGHGPARGALRSENGPARVTFQLSGKILVGGKARDLEVSCEGESVQTRTHVSRRGGKLVGCVGRRMTVVVSASAFHFGLKSRRWQIDIPDGVNGKISGRFRDAGRPAEEQPAEPEAPAER